MTYDSKGEFRCYEIKVSKGDFNSTAKKSFYGDYNCYVMPVALYEELGRKQYFDKYEHQDIGIITFDQYQACIKKPRKKHVAFDTRADLIESMLRSMFREEKKLYEISPYWE